MSALRLKMLLAALVACAGHSASADVTCSFHVRATINEIHKLSDHTFRVREADRVLHLEQRLANGGWLALGTVQRYDSPGFTVFLHLPNEGRYSGRSRMLTIHQSGHGSLAIHHGSAGGGSQIERAWLYQGECWETP